MPRHQAISPNRPLTVEIPTGLDAAIATSSQVDSELINADSMASVTATTEADIKIGERTAFIPMTCQEMQILDRLDCGLQQAACLWRDLPEQQEHEKLLGSALYHWQSVQDPSMDNSWVWEVGRWSTQFSLPFALELRRLDPCAMSDADQLLAQATCQRNRQLEAAAKRLTAPATATSAAPAATTKKKGAIEQDDPAEEEPCLCQIRWGLAPDTEAAKRRQVEKLLLDEAQPPPRRGGGLQKQLKRQQQQQQQQQQKSPNSASASCDRLSKQHQQQQQQQPRRPIVKTSHLREQYSSTSSFDDAGYASQGNSPPGLHHNLQYLQQHQQQQTAAPRPHSGHANSYIAGLLSTACYGGRDWVD